MPQVDVIIPAFNSARYLRAALDSVLVQTFENWRIILVNDGSTDDTPEVVAPYRELLGDKLLYIHQSNKGLPAARNAAIRHSSAEFLALLDADDVWLPCRLAKSLKCFEGHPKTGLSYGLITRIDAEGRPIDTFMGNGVHGEGMISSYIYMRKVEFPCPSVTFRRRCLDQVGTFDENMRATEDRDLWLRIAFHYEVAFIPDVIAYYRTSSSSMSADSTRMLKAQLHFLAKHYGEPGCGMQARQVARALAYKQYAEAAAAQGRLVKAFCGAVRAFALYPFDLDNLKIVGSLILRCFHLES